PTTAASSSAATPTTTAPAKMGLAMCAIEETTPKQGSNVRAIAFGGSVCELRQSTTLNLVLGCNMDIIIGANLLSLWGCIIDWSQNIIIFPEDRLDDYLGDLCDEDLRKFLMLRLEDFQLPRLDFEIEAPSLEEFLGGIPGGDGFYSVLDIKDAFHSVQLSPRVKKYMTIRVGSRLFEYQ
ncbi:hypothetical protein FOZ62_006314, partial [Perkinsus olseni]